MKSNNRFAQWLNCISVTALGCATSLPHACPVTALGCGASPPLYPMCVLSQRWGVPTLYPTRVLSQRWGVPPCPLSAPRVSCHSVGVCPLSTPCVSCHSVGVCRLAPSLPHACPLTALGCAASPPLYPMRVLSQRWGVPPLYPTRVLSQRWGVPPHPLSTPRVSCPSVGVCRLTPSLPHACPVTALGCAASPPLYPTRVLSQRWGVPPHPLSTPRVSCHSVGVCPLSTPCVSCHSVGVCRLARSLPHGGRAGAPHVDTRLRTRLRTLLRCRRPLLRRRHRALPRRHRPHRVTLADSLPRPARRQRKSMTLRRRRWRRRRPVDEL